MKTRLWEVVAGLGSLLLALDSTVNHHYVRLVVATAIFLWIARRILPRYAVFRLFLRRAVGRWRLGPTAVLNTIALGLRLNRLLTPEIAAGRLEHGRTSSGWAYAAFVPIVGEAAAAQAALRQLSFYNTGDTVTLAHSLESLRELAVQLDRIDGSLTRSSGGALGASLQVTDFSWHLAESAQSALEGRFRGRSGADGEWFRRVIAKRRDMLTALGEGQAAMVRIKEKAIWMLERQRECGSGDEVELLDVSAARGELREAARLVS